MSIALCSLFVLSLESSKNKALVPVGTKYLQSQPSHNEAVNSCFYSCATVIKSRYPHAIPMLPALKKYITEHLATFRSGNVQEINLRTRFHDGLVTVGGGSRSLSIPSDASPECIATVTAFLKELKTMVDASGRQIHSSLPTYDMSFRISNLTIGDAAVFGKGSSAKLRKNKWWYRPHVQNHHGLKGNQQLVPYDKSNLQLVPHDKSNLQVVPYHKSNPSVVPYDKTNLPHVLYDKSNLHLFPYNKGNLHVFPYDKSNLPLVPYDKSNLQIVPYDKSNLQIVPYDKSNLQIVPYDKSNLQIVPYDKSNLQIVPYDKSNLQIVPYDKSNLSFLTTRAIYRLCPTTQAPSRSFLTIKATCTSFRTTRTICRSYPMIRATHKWFQTTQSIMQT